MVMGPAQGPARCVRWSLRTSVMAFVIVAVIGHVQTADGNEPSAAQVKAAFLFNFTKFVEWPEPSDGSLIIGIAGDDDFAEIVAFAVRGRSLDRRKLETRRLGAGDDPSGCSVLFVGPMRPHDAAALMRRVRGGVLTVGETVQFLRDGGLIRLFIENGKLRFEISQKNAEAAGLKISSQLLMLAAK
jgi:hypothetical protein